MSWISGIFAIILALLPVIVPIAIIIGALIGLVIIAAIVVIIIVVVKKKKAKAVAINAPEAKNVEAAADTNETVDATEESKE